VVTVPRAAFWQLGWDFSSGLAFQGRATSLPGAVISVPIQGEKLVFSPAFWCNQAFFINFLTSPNIFHAFLIGLKVLGFCCFSFWFWGVVLFALGVFFWGVCAQIKVKACHWKLLMHLSQSFTTSVSLLYKHRESSKSFCLANTSPLSAFSERRVLFLTVIKSSRLDVILGNAFFKQNLFLAYFIARPIFIARLITLKTDLLKGVFLAWKECGLAHRQKMQQRNM